MVNVSTLFHKNFFFCITSIKSKIFPTIFSLLVVFLLIFSNSNLAAAKTGLKIWANNIVPSLLPFFIATELLSYTDICNKLSNICNKFMRPLFNVPGSGAYAFILGIISGYPVGAKIVSDIRAKNECTKNEGERLLAFTNNSGPLFIIGSIGITFFRNSLIGLLLLITHILSSITVGIFLGLISRLKYKKSNQIFHNSTHIYTKKESCTFSNLGEILRDSIFASIKSILLIGGFVVMFSVIISILKTSKFFDLLSTILSPISNILGLNKTFMISILTGIIELTNGISSVCSITTKYLSISILTSSFLLGFGGISVLLQVLSITSKTDLSIKYYFFGKIFQGLFSVFYTFLFLQSFAFLQFNL